MKAMILAAGLGTRMRPLTDSIPKPLLTVGDSTLIELHLHKLAQAGIRDVVINVSYLGEQIEEALGEGESYGLRIQYSREAQPLETAGGIQQALPLLGDDAFLLINADVWTDFPLGNLVARALQGSERAHLVLVDNPEHHPQGDFSIGSKGELQMAAGQSFTFSGISVMQPSLFKEPLASNRLVDLFHQLIRVQQGKACQISAEHYAGQWVDVGTPERLQFLRDLLAAQ